MDTSLLRRPSLAIPGGRGCRTNIGSTFAALIEPGVSLRGNSACRQGNHLRFHVAVIPLASCRIGRRRRNATSACGLHGTPSVGPRVGHSIVSAARTVAFAGGTDCVGLSVGASADENEFASRRHLSAYSHRTAAAVWSCCPSAAVPSQARPWLPNSRYARASAGLRESSAFELRWFN